MASDPPAGATVADGIVVLDRVHRFGSGIASLAAAIRRGDADGVIELLDVRPTALPGSRRRRGLASEEALAPVRERAVAAAAAGASTPRARAPRRRRSRRSAAFRVLCAHRRGPQGVATWTARIEGWLASEVGGLGSTARGTSGDRCS